MSYGIVKNKPVAKFYYQGNHNRPIQRTVLITEADGTKFTGYEVREGNTVRTVEDAPVKSFRRDQIATREDLRSDSALRKTLKNGESTLKRMSITAAEEAGF